MSTHLLDSVADATSHRDRDELAHAVASLLLPFLEANAVTLYRLVEEAADKRVARQVLVTSEGSRFGPDLTHPATSPLLSEVPVWEQCALGRQVVQVDEADGRSISVFPIESERDVVGILVVDAPKALPSREVALIRGMLRILKNHLALLDYGERDTLTGLLNRKTFESRFEKLRSRMHVAAEAPPSWIGLMDIDKFKSINDSHGHLFGDEILLLISGLLKQTLRGADEVFRFGGEEFVIVLEQTTRAGADIAFERVRAGIEANRFPQIGRVTISLGFTHILEGDGPTTCVERADAALYYAKRNGRNNVRNFETLVTAGELVPKDTSADVELF
jgi:diguanylate cyclase (GGDEF)-like protein